MLGAIETMMVVALLRRTPSAPLLGSCSTFDQMTNEYVRENGTTLSTLGAGSDEYGRACRQPQSVCRESGHVHELCHRMS